MANLETRYYKIEKLLKWENREQVDEMLLQGMNPEKVSKWCKENGFSISKQKLYDYKEMIRKAAAKQITVEALIGMGGDRRVPVVLEQLGMGNVQEIVKNEIEVLDAIVQIGFDNLKQMGNVTPKDMLRAIELKDKITGGSMAGLSLYGIDQLRELEEKKFGAILEVVMKYLPEDKLEEIQEAIEIAEREFYVLHAPEYLEDYDNQIAQMQQEELLKATGDSTVVSDGI